MHVMLNGEPLEEVDCFNTWGSKWQLMDDVKEMWYTERMRGIERGSAERCAEQQRIGDKGQEVSI